MKILYWGPITPEGMPNQGGFEAANRKNINALRRHEIDVEEFPFPIVSKKLGPLGKLAYVRLFFTPLSWLRYRGRKDVILHMASPNGPLTLPTVWAQKVARRLGLTILTDMRAGTLPHFWSMKSGRYRKLISSLLKHSDAVTVEGRSYIEFMRSKVGLEKDAIYFPNTAEMAADEPESGKSLPSDGTGTINIFYFGRITTTKGFDIILDARKHLPAKYRFFLAGPVAPDIDPASLATEGIEYLGLLTPAQLATEMSRMHFFIFPTRHYGEGQSNSLIEAMGNGLVPVTSRQGFCSDVVADCGVTFPADATGEDYARAISNIAESDYTLRSRQCRSHIYNNHNIDIEIPKLINLYKSLIR